MPLTVAVIMQQLTVFLPPAPLEAIKPQVMAATTKNLESGMSAQLEHAADAHCGRANGRRSLPNPC